MFIGHFAVGLAVKSQTPKTSLATLFVAAQFLDLLWPILLLLGVEHVEVQPGITSFSPFNFTDYPISHSFGMVLIWSLLAGAVAVFFHRDRRAAVWIGLSVASHWVLDLVVHRPDLPLFPGNGTRVGLGVWNNVAATLTIETALLTAGAWVYMRWTAPRDGRGRWGLWGLIGFLIVAYAAASFSPPPSGQREIALAGMSMWLLVVWAYWVDRNRVASGIGNVRG